MNSIVANALPACRICGSPRIVRRLDFGPQPICNRFLTRRDEAEERFPLALMQCEACGVLQLERVPPPDALRPRYEWITYREAEAHLDQMVEDAIAASGIGPDARVIGSNYKDASTLERFRSRGFSRASMIEPRRHLGVDSDRAEIETVQERLTEDRMRDLAAREGPADLVIMRHVIEHTHDIHRFARAVRALTRPGGCVVFEVPDFAPSLKHFDYSTLWEEHVYCFTPATLPATCARLGFEVLRVENYAYPIENALVVMVRVPDVLAPRAAAPLDLNRELVLGRAYGEQLPVIAARLRAYLDDFSRTVGPVALFGAGHLTCKFVNFMGIADRVRFVADGDPKKIGLFMPGSRLPIVHPDELERQGIRLCLLGLSAESEARVREVFKSFTERGGRFASISPISPTRLQF
jgi:SAM-dependent methyltransferase